MVGGAFFLPVPVFRTIAKYARGGGHVQALLGFDKALFVDFVKVRFVVAR